jgi:hypothetical protein
MVKLNLAIGSGTVPVAPLTIDLYWTANRTAETYLGSVNGVTNPTAGIQIPITALQPDGTLPGGYLRIQTHSDAYGQRESSQYSRTTAVPTGACVPADFSVTKLAYSDSARTQLIPDGSVLPSGSTVYFTYVLTNLSPVSDTVVTSVTDDDKTDGPVCSDVPLTAGQVDSTSCRWQTIITRP